VLVVWAFVHTAQAQWRYGAGLDVAQFVASGVYQFADRSRGSLLSSFTCQVAPDLSWLPRNTRIWLDATLFLDYSVSRQTNSAYRTLSGYLLTGPQFKWETPGEKWGFQAIASMQLFVEPFWITRSPFQGTRPPDNSLLLAIVGGGGVGLRRSLRNGNSLNLQLLAHLGRPVYISDREAQGIQPNERLVVVPYPQLRLVYRWGRKPLVSPPPYPAALRGWRRAGGPRAGGRASV